MNQDRAASNDEAVPCSNGCGFFGRASTGNMCSRCYKESLAVLAKEKASSSEVPQTGSATSSSSKSGLEDRVSPIDLALESSKRLRMEAAMESPVRERIGASAGPAGPTLSPSAAPAASPVVAKAPSEAAPAPAAAAVDRSRCAECKKKVGLTGIECRCGKVYCGAHRMAEKHACTFDFKTFGRQNIEKQNERVVAQSLVDKL